MKLTRNEALEVYSIIENMLNKSDKVKMNFRLFEEQEKIDPEKDRLAEVMKPSEKMQEFEQKRMAMCKQHCKKDKVGNPIMNGNFFEGLKGNKKFEQAFNELKKEYKEDIEKFEEKNKELNELLVEEIEIKFDKIDLDLIPDGIMTGVEMRKLKRVGIL